MMAGALWILGGVPSSEDGKGVLLLRLLGRWPQRQTTKANYVYEFASR